MCLRDSDVMQTPLLRNFLINEGLLCLNVNKLAAGMSNVIFSTPPKSTVSQLPGSSHQSYPLHVKNSNPFRWLSLVMNYDHCKLNFIERFWCAAKYYTRENCGYTLDDLRKTIRAAFQSVPVATINRHYRHCVRTIEAYKDGFRYGPKEFVDGHTKIIVR